MEEHVIQNEPEFDEMARRTVREYEAQRRRGDDPGAPAGVTAPVAPPPSARGAGSVRPSPGRDNP